MPNSVRTGINALHSFPDVDENAVHVLLADLLKGLHKKIVVLDDDPTGVQTVHGISVYTDWQVASLEKAFNASESMFFVLTNSRGFTAAQTEEAHEEIAKNLAAVSKKTGKDFIVISRGDSTLRGHYPLETDVLRSALERELGVEFDGEIICPFFKEGGRFTLNNTHYVREGEELVPAGQTEFAKDKTFGYVSSLLPAWCEEKSKGRYPADGVVCISLEMLRTLDYDAIEKALLSATGFGKIIVNAIDYVDIMAFSVAFCRAVQKGHTFLFRSAAAIPKVLGGISNKPLLTAKDLIEADNSNGGIVVVGSHIKKSTDQLNDLYNAATPLEFIEFKAARVAEEGGLEDEVARIVQLAEENIAKGKSVVVFTSRDLYIPPTADKDVILSASVRISAAVTSIIGKLTVKPSFIVAKGGITSSDVGTKALQVKQAEVMGQIKPGIPVWKTGSDSKFPYMPYVIFPGNVGEVSTLREVVEILAAK